MSSRCLGKCRDRPCMSVSSVANFHQFHNGQVRRNKRLAGRRCTC
jgi:hypothetical protein